MLSEILAQIQDSEAISSTSMRYISDNIQFSRMKNTIYPQTSPQVYGYGLSETVSDIPPQRDTKDTKLNTYDSNFYMDSSLHNQQGLFAICSQSPSTFNHQSEPSSLMSIKRLDCPSFGANHLTTKATIMPTHDNDVKQQKVTSNIKSIPGQCNEIGTKTNARKRPIESVDITTKRSNATVTGKKPSQSEWTRNKKVAMYLQQNLHDHQVPKESKEAHKDRVTVRRSQKLADKITALQKLVSPYGKTDTASVLHEASVFIKFLQDQIQNRFQSLRNASLDDEYPQSKMKGEIQQNLRSKGFCLVPVSLTQNLIRLDAFNPYSPINMVPPQNTLTHFS